MCLREFILGGRGLGQGHLEFGPDNRQWRAELVGRIGREFALGSESVLEPLQHRVELVAQLAQFVMRPSERDALMQIVVG